MRVICHTEENFYEAIHKFVEKGLTFDADFETLVITLTGGH